MRDAEPTTRSGGLRVAGPNSLPGGEALARAWRGLPLLARAFVALALVDVAVRTFGILGLSLSIDLGQPLTAFAFLPHLCFVLFPVAVLARRPDAATETPLVLWGSVALALVELLSAPLFALVPGTAGNLATWTLLQVVAVAARAGGYVALAVGVAALTRSAPSQSILGASNLAMGVIAASALTSILLLLVLPPADFGDPAWTSQVQLVNAIGPLPTVAFAYLARVLVRGTVDLRRPIVATYVATGAIGLATFQHLATLAVNLLVLVQLVFALSSATLDPGIALGLPLIGIGVDVLLVVAVGLGLADTSVRIPPRGTHRPIEPEPAPEPFDWPAPGTDVPAYRPIGQSADANASGPAKASRRLASNDETPG